MRHTYTLEKNEIMTFSEQWMGQQVIVAHKTAHTQKDKYYAFSPICRI